MSIRFSKLQEKELSRLLVRGFTKKQFVVLDAVSRDKSRSITSASKKISREKKIPLSTVKLDLRILAQLGLVRIVDGEFKKIRVTKFGKMILGVLSNYNPTLLPQLLEILVRPFHLILGQR